MGKLVSRVNLPKHLSTFIYVIFFLLSSSFVHIKLFVSCRREISVTRIPFAFPLCAFNSRSRLIEAEENHKIRSGRSLVTLPVYKRRERWGIKLNFRYVRYVQWCFWRSHEDITAEMKFPRLSTLQDSLANYSTLKCRLSKLENHGRCQLNSTQIAKPSRVFAVTASRVKLLERCHTVKGSSASSWNETKLNFTINLATKSLSRVSFKTVYAGEFVEQLLAKGVWGRKRASLSTNQFNLDSIFDGLMMRWLRGWNKAEGCKAHFTTNIIFCCLRARDRKGSLRNPFDRIELSDLLIFLSAEPKWDRIYEFLVAEKLM